MTRARKAVKPYRQLNQDPARLKRRRIAARLSITELAAIAGCSVPYLSQLENGHYSARPQLLGALADALGCDITDIMAPEPGTPSRTALPHSA